jgi:hypothetical protein
VKTNIALDVNPAVAVVGHHHLRDPAAAVAAGDA